MRLVVEQTTKRLAGELIVPNSKYHAHRALILASLARGRTRIVGLTDAKHVAFTLSLLRGLGTKISVEGDTFVVEGGPYHPRRQSLSVGSSGTTFYFMIGLCALADRPVTLTGQRYFQRRPVGPLLDALRQMGIDARSPDGRPPIAIGNGRPTGGHVTIPGTLSQWISGLLVAAPFAQRETTIEVVGALNERPYIELTIEMMRQFGLEAYPSGNWRSYRIPPNQQARAATIELPPDIGSAAFGLAITALHPSDVLLRGLTSLHGEAKDHPEIAFLDVVREMGLPMEYLPSERAVRVRHDGLQLRPARVDCREIPDMLPILSTLAAFADGESTFDNIEHVRLKESDRVASMLQLNKMGGDLRVEGSRLLIRGVEKLTGKDLSSYNDHRVLMSLAVAGTRAAGRTTLTYPHAYRISYPAFLNAMNAIGARMESRT